MAVARRAFTDPNENPLGMEDPILAEQSNLLPAEPATPMSPEAGMELEPEPAAQYQTAAMPGAEWHPPASTDLLEVQPSFGATQGAAATAAATTEPDWNRYEQGRTYNPMPGWDTGKLQDLEHQNAKYDFARAVQTLGIPSQQARGNLEVYVDWLQARGYPDARVTSDDKIDFGDGYGPVDVVDRHGNWIWLPDSAQGGGQPPPTPTVPSPTIVSGVPGGTTASITPSGAGAQGPRLDYGYAPPGDAGVFDPTLLQQVSDDPLSQLITAALAGLLTEGGQTPFGTDLEETLRQLIGEGGGGGEATPFGKEMEDTIRNLIATSGDINDPAIRARFESARELENKAMRTQMTDARAALAGRNILSEPGMPQGPETTAVRRITESIAPEFARATRDIYATEMEAADKRKMEALGLGTGMATAQMQARDSRLVSLLTQATGLAEDQARTILDTANAGTDRQAALANIALRSLEDNMVWNQFLAQYGLDRERLMNEIENGNTENVTSILSLFMQFASLIRGGYIGND